MKEGTKDFVAACVNPEGFRGGVRLEAEEIHIINDILGTVDVRFAKAIAVVPFFYFLIIMLEAIIAEHFPDFRIGEAEVFVKLYICDGKNIEVVESCEDAFFCNPKAAGQNGELDAVVSLQSTSEQASNQIDHFVVVSVMLCFIERDIVFVNEKDCFLSIMFKEKAGQSQKAVF